MLISTLTIKGQATIPAKIREVLHLAPGDRVQFDVKNNVVLLKKVEPFDFAHHEALSQTLSEWNSPEDDEAFHDL